MFWNSQIWIDETQMELIGLNKFSMCGENIMIWVCFSAEGVGGIEIIEGRMNEAKYTNILSTHLLKSANDLGLDRNFVFQQDNDPKHTAKLTKKWFEDNDISVLDWPSPRPQSN